MKHLLLATFLLVISLPAHWVRAAVPAGFGAPAGAGPALPVLAERHLFGQWRGLLVVPGGSLEVTIDVTELPDGRRSALLDVPLQRLSRVPLTVALAGDSVQFAATRPALRFAGRWVASDKLVGTWRQGGTATPLTLEHVAGSEPAAKAPASAYTSEEVRFVNSAATAGPLASSTGPGSKDGLAFAGTLTRPPGKGPFPAVVLVSDLGPQTRDAVYDGYRLFVELADGLTKAGFAVLRYDDRGVGNSTGVLANATAAELATDAQAALNFLRARADVDGTHLGLVGHGEGANVALLAAAGPLPPAFVAALGGYGIPGHEALVQQQTALLKSAGAEPDQVEAATRRQRDMLAIIRNLTDKTQTQAIVANMLRQDAPGLDAATAQASAGQMLTRAYRAFLDFDPQAQLSQVKCPVLLLAGTADEQVNADVNLAALQKGLRANKAVTATKLPGVNHLLQPDMQEWPVVGGQARPVPAASAQAALTTWLQRQTGR